MSSIWNKTTHLRLDAPIGAMRRKARKEQGAWQMQGESQTRPGVSTLVYGDGRGKVNYNINLKAEGLGPMGSPRKRRWLRCAEVIALFWSRGRIFDAISDEGVAFLVAFLPKGLHF